MAAHRDIFSKHLPNVKLATRYDADGKEIQVERREDSDAVAKMQETFDMLVTAGYCRAGSLELSAFDRVVGGMAWCIECCDFAVDVDLLFHETFTIGQKIALVEKLIAVLVEMKCPYIIEPHQVQGLEFIAIHPVIEWLVRTSVERRADRNLRLKRDTNQRHQDFQDRADKFDFQKLRAAAERIRYIMDIYGLTEDFSDYGPINSSGQRLTAQLRSQIESAMDGDEADSIAAKRQPKASIEREAQLLELQKQRTSLENKILQYREAFQTLQSEVVSQRTLNESKRQQAGELRAQIAEYEEIQTKADPELLQEIKALLLEHEQAKTKLADWKNKCRAEAEVLQQQEELIETLKQQDPESVAVETTQLDNQIHELRLQIAKRNRGIVNLQRKLDAVPDRSELRQYQRRFHELYDEMSAKHLETKQYYAQYNTLNDKIRCLEKELSLLNSICESYTVSVQSPQGREDFLKQFEAIVNGVKQAEEKMRQKFSEERLKRNRFNDELQGLLELQRQYAAAIKHLTEQCQQCEILQNKINALKSK